MPATGTEAVSLERLKSVLDYTDDKYLAAPSEEGTAGQVIISDGSGGTSWTSIETGATYTGTSPISVSGSVISHEESGVTAGSYGLSAAATPAFGGTFNVPYVTVDSTGHTTAASTYAVTIPSTTASSSSAGLMSATDKAKLDGIEESATSGGITSLSGTSPITASVSGTTGTISIATCGEGTTGATSFATTSDFNDYMGIS